MRSAIIVAVVASVVVATAAQAQDAAPPEHAGVGFSGATGIPGAVAAVRVSVPATPRLGFDIEAGRGLTAGDPYTAVGGQMRWHWRGRSVAGGSMFGVFGAVVHGVTQRTEIRFPDRTFVQTERKTAVAPQLGVGWDWQARHGTRLGVELTTGGSTAAGPRILAKLFAVWGRPLRS